jgi:hypothetical protein
VWRHYQNRYAAQQDVLQYISMVYNYHRLHSYLGYKTPNLTRMSGFTESPQFYRRLFALSQTASADSPHQSLNRTASNINAFGSNCRHTLRVRIPSVFYSIQENTVKNARNSYKVSKPASLLPTPSSTRATKSEVDIPGV